MNNMDEINKTIRYNNLLNIYGSQLTPTQAKILEDYFVFDLSLGEIADNREVSRAAVEDAIKKGLKKLEALEKDLRLLEKQEKILSLSKRLKEAKLGDEANEIADELERIIE